MQLVSRLQFVIVCCSWCNVVALMGAFGYLVADGELVAVKVGAVTLLLVVAVMCGWLQ